MLHSLDSRVPRNVISSRMVRRVAAELGVLTLELVDAYVVDQHLRREADTRSRIKVDVLEAGRHAVKGKATEVSPCFTGKVKVGFGRTHPRFTVLVQRREKERKEIIK